MTAKVEAKVEDFKSALHESLTDLPAGRTVKQLADIAGVSYSTLWECADTEKSGWISVRRLIRIIPSLSNFAVLDYLERLAGRIAFRIPDQREVCGEQMGKAIKEFGEFVVEGSQGGWTADRAAQLRREAEEAAAAILHYAHCVEAQVQPTRKLEAVGGQR